MAGVRVKVPRLFYFVEFVVSDLPSFLILIFFIMTTNFSVNKNQKEDSSNKNLNPKEFLIALENFPAIPDYKNLGFTLNSLCNILKTVLLTRTELLEYADFDDHDLFNTISLLQSLLPREDEFELLDLLNE